ncbi:MAG: hypothetical protein ACTSQ9_00885, partial [Candidatus Hodarchaeales archaeon]
QNFQDCINSIPKSGIVPELDDSRNQANLMANKTSLTTEKATPSRKTRKTTTKSKTKKTRTKTTKSDTKKSSAKKVAPKKAPTKKTTPRKVAPRKLSSKKSQLEQKTQKSLNGFFLASTDVITTPPCPECKKGYLLPYSESMKCLFSLSQSGFALNAIIHRQPLADQFPLCYLLSKNLLIPAFYPRASHL